MCGLQILAKASATALFAVTNSTWLLVFLASDHLLHFVYRLSRRDMVFFFTMPRGAAYAVAPIARIVFKVFTECVQVRPLHFLSKT
jgi:hypothetical protein